MRLSVVTITTLLLSSCLLSSTLGASAQGLGGGTKADAERSVQNYLALWSSDGDFDAAVVDRFYAPHVDYYGKSFTRRQVLADKQAYARQWPVRHYREVPGSFAARCNADRSLCQVRVVMAWRRINRHDVVSTGQARMMFAFVPTEGGRKIAREGAIILH